jgi:hypothetical protein
MLLALKYLIYETNIVFKMFIARVNFNQTFEKKFKLKHVLSTIKILIKCQLGFFFENR